MGIIYCLHFPNSKRYVGKTRANDLVKRMKEHEYGAKHIEHRYLYNAIRKYGWVNVEWWILEQKDDDDELNEAERKWIEEFQTTNSKCGYNLRSGGEGGEHAESTKQKISESNMGSKNGMYGKKPWNKGKKLSKEHVENLRRSHLGQKAWNKGKKLGERGPRSDRVKEKIGMANRGENNGHSKFTWEIINAIREEYKQGEVTQKELAEKYEISASHVSNIVNNRVWRV